MKPNKPRFPQPGPPAAPTPAVIVITPTYLLHSETKEMLRTRGGLSETEARRVLARNLIKPAPMGGEFKKYHYLKVEAYCDYLRANAEASLEPPPPSRAFTVWTE